MRPALADSTHSSPGRQAETNEIVPCEQCYEGDDKELTHTSEKSLGKERHP